MLGLSDAVASWGRRRTVSVCTANAKSGRRAILRRTVQLGTFLLATVLLATVLLTTLNLAALLLTTFVQLALVKSQSVQQPADRRAVNSAELSQCAVVFLATQLLPARLFVRRSPQHAVRRTRWSFSRPGVSKSARDQRQSLSGFQSDQHHSRHSCSHTIDAGRVPRVDVHARRRESH